MAYDGLERKISMNDPDAGVSTNLYDAASNLLETKDAKGQVISYTYDGVNRLLTEDYHDDASPEFSYHRSPDVAYFYDQPAPSVALGDGTSSTAQNTKGRLAYVDDASGQEHTSFDARGRIQWTVKRIPDPQLDSALAPNPVALVSYQTAFEYDPMDRVTRLVYPDNDAVGYEYNERGLMGRITGGPSASLLSNFVYTPSAQQQELDFGNGVRTTYDYDPRLRLDRLHTVSPASTPNPQLIDFAYSFDAVSNIKAIQDQRPASLIPAADQRRNTQTFAYDDLYRLTRVQYNLPNPASSNGGEINYRYDPLGNLLAQTSNITRAEEPSSATDLGTMAYGGSAGRANRMGRAPNDPPGPHALTTILPASSSLRSFPYDPNGNMTNIDGLRCTWDFKDRLVAAEDDTMRADYRYDYTDRRVIKQVWSKSASNSQAPVTVAYPGKHFEVREHDEPIKYILNGDARVARITGSLSTNARVQRLRLYTGWNLCSVAVSGSRLAGAPVSAAYKWDQSAWVSVSTNEILGAGTVLWLFAPTNGLLALLGAYADPTNRLIPAGSSFVPGAGLECLPLAGDQAAVTPETAWSSFDPLNRLWQRHEPSVPFSDPDLPEVLAPGEALFVRSEAPATLEAPAPALRVRYYHQDHLGSSSVLTDANGALVEETAFYPFGLERHVERMLQAEEPYQFAEKERDRESGLCYFEARYLAGAIARFVSVDPKYLRPDALSSDELRSFLSRPQAMNLYSYGYNNPISYNDPSGMDPVSKLSTGADVVGVAAGATDEASILAELGGAKPPGWLGTGTSVAGKAAVGVSVGIKAVQFIEDPNEATGGQLLNESAKGAMGLACPPVGLIWSVLDLTGYGPSAILQNTEASIQANRAATKAYNETTATYQGMTKMINQRLPQLEAQQQQARERLKVLEQKTAAWRQQSLKALKGETRSLAELQAAIKRQERINRQTAARLRNESPANQPAAADDRGERPQLSTSTLVFPTSSYPGH